MERSTDAQHFSDHAAQDGLVSLWERLGVPQYSIAELFLGSLDEGAVVQDTDGVVRWSTPTAARILGLKNDELTGRTCVDPRWQAIRSDGSVLPGEEHPAMRTLASGEEHDDFVMGIVRPNGERRWISIRTRLVRSEAGAICGVLTVFRDVSDDHLTRERVRTMSTFAPIGMGCIDRDGSIILTNPRLAETIGQDLSGLTPVDLVALAHPAHKDDLEAAIEGASDPHNPHEFDLELPVEVHGAFRWVHLRFAPVRNGDRIDGCIFTVEDVHDERAATEALEYRARHDALTALVNRTVFEGKLREIAALPDARVAVLLIDLDGFKEINDSLGHQAGDQLLRRVAQRLRSTCRSADVIARMGGDEFAVTISNTAPGQPELYAERIVDALRQPIEIDGMKVHVGASIGIAIQTESSADSAAELLRQADMAMYAAKAQGRNRFVVFQDPMAAGANRRFAIRSALPSAVDASEFNVCYQPVVGLADGAIEGFEALVRWESDRLGAVSPAEFIPVAEETGDIQRLGLHVLDLGLAALAQWKPLTTTGISLHLSFNVSRHQFADPVFFADVAAVIRSHGIDPSFLVMEATEATLRTQPTTATALRRLADMGCRIAIDDFGTGDASFTSLRRLPVDILKVDRSLVKLIDTDERGARALLRAVVDCAGALDLSTIAQGVETRRQLAEVSALGFISAQGFLFSQPLPLDGATELLRTSATTSLVEVC